MPLIDLTFAISATSISANSTFLLMTATINSIVSVYDIVRIHYSVIVFGSVSTTHVNFGTNIPNKEHLIRIVARLSKEAGPVNLALALEDAKRVYQSQEVRPNARRFLVVIMDNQADNLDNVDRAVTDLDNLDVVVISVSIGNSTNSTDFEIITKDPRHIITTGVNKSPVELGKEIIDAIFISVRSKSCLVFCFFVNTPLFKFILHLPFNSFIHLYAASFSCILPLKTSTFPHISPYRFISYDKPSYIFIDLDIPHTLCTEEKQANKQTDKQTNKQTNNQQQYNKTETQ